MAEKPWKVTACGPNQASYSMTTTWLLPSTTSGPTGNANDSELASRTAKAIELTFTTGL